MSVEIDSQDWAAFILEEDDAVRFSDLRSIAHDLMQVAACCRKYRELDEAGESEFAMAVLDSALIRYRRCFTKGKRFSLPTDISHELSDELSLLHRYVLDLASKHVAHSVSDYEQFTTVVVPKKTDRGATVLGWLGPCDIVKSMMPEDVEKIAMIAQKILDELVVPSTQVLWSKLIEKWAEADDGAYLGLRPVVVVMDSQTKVVSRAT